MQLEGIAKLIPQGYQERIDDDSQYQNFDTEWRRDASNLLNQVLLEDTEDNLWVYLN